MRMKHKPWAEPFLLSHPEFVITLETFKNDDVQEFLNKENIYIEIGTGKGGFILGMAQKNPDKYFLGVEINETAAGFCAKKIYENDIKNVKLINIDVKYLFEHLPQNHFDGIYLNFSDPWPKKRHAKRRLTHPDYLRGYANILKEEGQIIQKTDNRALFDYSLECYEEELWNISSVDYDYKGLDSDVATEYETKFRSLGTPINRAIIVKGDDTRGIK